MIKWKIRTWQDQGNQTKLKTTSLHNNESVYLWQKQRCIRGSTFPKSSLLSVSTPRCLCLTCCTGTGAVYQNVLDSERRMNGKIWKTGRCQSLSTRSARLHVVCCLQARLWVKNNNYWPHLSSTYSQKLLLCHVLLLDTERLKKECMNKSPAVARVSRPYSWCTLATCVHNCPSMYDVSNMLLPAPEV